jgi:hypothetical protein
MDCVRLTCSIGEELQYIVQIIRPVLREATCFSGVRTVTQNMCWVRYLNTAVLFTNTPHEYKEESTGAPESRSVMGSRGSSIVFSWTWNENRKNDIDELRRAYGSSGRKGVCVFCWIGCESCEGLCLKPAWSSANTVGRNPSAVRPVDSLTSKSREAQAFHLNRTFDAHQKLATLSSNSPREKGNIREMGWRIPEMGEKGGRNGKKRSRNVSEVMAPSRTKRARLRMLSQ